jgi:BRCT domain type II-containing protein
MSVLEGITFSFCSSIRSSYKLSTRLKQLGAQVSFVVSSDTNFVVCSREEYDRASSYKIKCAKKYNVTIVEQEVFPVVCDVNMFGGACENSFEFFIFF